MYIKITTAAIAVLLAKTVSAQAPVTESAERVVHLTTTPTRRDFQEMATALRTVAQIRDLTVDSGHNSFVLHGTPSDLAMAEWLVHMMDKPAGWQPSDQETWNPATREFRVPVGPEPVARVYYLINTTSAQGLQEIITVIRTVAEIQKIFSFTPARVLAFRGSADEVELADWLARKMDLSVTAQGHASAQGVEGLRQESAADLYRLPVPQRDGSEDLVRVFYLSPTVSLPGISEMINAMHKRGGIQKVFCHTAPPALAVRGNPRPTRTGRAHHRGGSRCCALTVNAQPQFKARDALFRVGGVGRVAAVSGASTCAKPVSGQLCESVQAVNVRRLFVVKGFLRCCQ